MTSGTRVLLSIETSCDETAAAVVGEDFKVLSSVIASQIPFHAEFGGVVPNIASRQHVIAMNGVVQSALDTAGVRPVDLEAIAVTVGPGLPGSLSVGISAAKALAFAWSKPLIAVNHLEGHLFSAELDDNQIKFPAVYLLVSGGHCMLVFAAERGKYELLGTTRDDSVGEAYDKVARELGFSYPGGPILDRMAPNGRESYLLPRPMLNCGYEFSFSGLKSAVRREIELGGVVVEDLVTSFVSACMDVLIVKLMRAVDEYAPSSAVVVGGVSASPVLRERLNGDITRGIQIVFPSIKYSTDNAAMIGAAGWWQFTNNGSSSDDFGISQHMQLPMVDWQDGGR